MSWYNPLSWDDATQKANEETRGQLSGQGQQAGDFANLGQGGTIALGLEADKARRNLADIASGKLSYSGEQLRQGLQQNLAGQRSMAAGAAPSNAAAAARTAAIQGGRLGYGLSGQTALAGIAERQGAAKALQDAILQQRQQDLQAALQSRGNAIQAYGGLASNPEQSWWDKSGGALIGAGGAIGAQLAKPSPTTASDRRLKHNVEEIADADAKKLLKGLRAYRFAYKDEKYGKGTQTGIMAQDLEKAGLGHAVEDTPAGKMVHGAKLATANTALIASLGSRLAKLEGKGR